MPHNNPADQEVMDLARQRERLGLEGFLISCIAEAELPRESLLAILRIGRAFGPLPADRYERSVLGELLRIVAIRPQILESILDRIGNGFLTLATVRKIARETDE